MQLVVEERRRMKLVVEDWCILQWVRHWTMQLVVVVDQCKKPHPI